MKIVTYFDLDFELMFDFHFLNFPFTSNNLKLSSKIPCFEYSDFQSLLAFML